MPTSIYIPSTGRCSRCTTLEQLSAKAKRRTYLVVPELEAAAYSKLHNKILAVPNRLKGIGHARQHILDHCGKRTALMLDDDMRFYKRIPKQFPKLEGLTPDNIEEMLDEVEHLLNGYAAVGISARQGNNRIAEPFREVARMNNAYAFNVKVLRDNNIRFDRMRLMEDFDVTLSLLRLGIPNIVTYRYCWNQLGSGANGGCSGYRTAELQRKAALQLAKLHKGFVRVVEKESKSSWKGIETRTDVNIQWRKAYASAEDK